MLCCVSSFFFLSFFLFPSSLILARYWSRIFSCNRAEAWYNFKIWMENLFITCYLKAAALLLNYLVLDRQKSQHLAITSLLLYIIVFILHWNIPESVINNLFLYFCGCFIPAFCSRFPIVWYICDIRLFFLYFFFLVFGIGQLVDLFFLRQV